MLARIQNRVVRAYTRLCVIAKPLYNRLRRTISNRSAETAAAAAADVSFELSTFSLCIHCWLRIISFVIVFTCNNPIVNALILMRHPTFVIHDSSSTVEHDSHDSHAYASYTGKKKVSPLQKDHKGKGGSEPTIIALHTGTTTRIDHMYGAGRGAGDGPGGGGTGDISTVTSTSRLYGIDWDWALEGI